MAYTPNLSFTSGEYATSTKINDLLDNVLAIYPVGALNYIHQPPTGVETTLLNKWIQCNGAAVSRTTYATLFALVGTAYGAGDGTSTFNLPDLRGRFPVSIAPGGHADVAAFGNNDGAALASRRMKHAHTFTNGSHTHTISGALASGGSHTHSYELFATTTGTSGGTNTNEYNTSLTTSPSTSSGGGPHTHTLSGWSANQATAVQSIGVAGTPTDQPAYIVAGCWYMAYQ